MGCEQGSFPTPETNGQHHRPTIGLLIRSTGMFLGGLQLEWQGVVDMAREQGVNLICFHGGALHSTCEFESQANVLYDLVSTERLDGLVIWSSNVGLYLTPEAIAEFLARYRPLPIVSCQYVSPGVPSILQYDAQGTREAMIHLIKVHGYRRIAFLRGPETHFGAQERFQAYIDTLLEQGLPVNSDLISPPVEWSEGSMAIASLLDERKLQPGIDFDAIVAPSDSIMLTAMSTLQARGIRIPGQVAVIGFDDSIEAGMAMPALTSVVTPFRELGRQAVLLLLAQLHGKQIPDRTFLPSTLVIRQSCGCLPRIINQTTGGQLKPGGKSFETIMAEHREFILAEMQRAVGNYELPRARAEILLDSFTTEMTSQSPNKFLHELSDILRQVIDSGGDIIAWDSALSALRGQALAYLPQELTVKAEDLLHQARIVISEAAVRVSARHTYRTHQYTHTLRNIGAALITTFDMNELMNLLAQDLPRLGIPGCYLAVYEDPGKSIEWARLLLAYDEHGRIPINPNRQRFSARQLIPEYLLPQNRRFSFTVEPLYFRENQLGYIVFEIGLVEPTVYEVLRTQISSALQGAILVQSLQQQSAQLEAANKELDAFAYSVSHDLRAPLRHIDGFIEILKNKIKVSLDDESRHYMDVIAESARKMGTLIDDLLAFSRVGRNEMSRVQVNLGEVVQDAIQELQPEVEGRNIQWKIASLPFVIGDRSMLRIILVNLISNALKFTRPKELAQIEIGYEKNDDAEIVVFVRDNGVGFDMTYADKLFGVFQRLHRAEEFEGTGIGLANVRRIISRHGGRTWAEGELNKGAMFCFSLPQSTHN